MFYEVPLPAEKGWVQKGEVIFIVAKLTTKILKIKK